MHGNETAIITTSNNFITHPIADRFGIETLMAVELERVDDRYTRRALGTPTFRKGKVSRLRESPWTRTPSSPPTRKPRTGRSSNCTAPAETKLGLDLHLSRRNKLFTRLLPACNNEVGYRQ